jgi:hypothetical protein
MKGGRAPRPSVDDIRRLRAVKDQYKANEVVLFEWRPQRGCTFSVLRGNKWKESSAETIFG